LPKKVRELKKALIEAGFTARQGKGSHSVWSHSLVSRAIVIARQDGADAPKYLEQQVKAALKQLEELE